MHNYNAVKTFKGSDTKDAHVSAFFLLQVNVYRGRNCGYFHSLAKTIRQGSAFPCFFIKFVPLEGFTDMLFLQEMGMGVSFDELLLFMMA